MAHDCNAFCTADWPAGRRCHCGRCGKDFSCVANFDKHRDKGECLSPESVGLIKNDRGVYRKEGETDFYDRLTEGKK